ncbi:hypothetical protein GCM10009863_55680 [Streptomyces axinellae]|uniref:Uncharacterized protein n=1 Tax=Streptomyces axinellae TaxID=552788 RepID=A0ABN3QQB0_9ACTN
MRAGRRDRAQLAGRGTGRTGLAGATWRSKPQEDAARPGCAVLTGYGAVHHGARVRPGSPSPAPGVGDVGGVGLAMLRSARLAGAGGIVADVIEDKEGPRGRPARRTSSSPPTGQRVRAGTGDAPWWCSDCGPFWGPSRH